MAATVSSGCIEQWAVGETAALAVFVGVLPCFAGVLLCCPDLLSDSSVSSGVVLLSPGGRTLVYGAASVTVSVGLGQDSV